MTAMVASANRDPEAYDDPETFDIFRDAQPAHVVRDRTASVSRNAPRTPGDTGRAQRTLRPASRPTPRPRYGEEMDAHIQGDSLFRNPTSLPVMWHQI